MPTRALAAVLLTACTSTEVRAPPPPMAPLSAELVQYQAGALTLSGFLYRPAGQGPFPAVVYAHGSEALPGAKEDQAQFFVPHGFVLFVPHRRGHGRSKAAGPPEPQGLGPAVMEALVAQSDDVLGAIAYVAALPEVDPKRVAVVGCSYGGIEALLAAERATGVSAAVDFAGGAMRWNVDGALRDRLVRAARGAKVPVLFVQAENDFSTEPSRVLAAAMQAEGKPATLRLFPPNGTSPQDGHHFCAGGASPPWGDEVLAFLAGR